MRANSDFINPFLSKDSGVISVWTFNLDNDTLWLQKKDRNLTIGLNQLRNHLITMADLQPCQPPQPPTALYPDPRIVRPSWTVKPQGQSMTNFIRRKAFIGRILRDFELQWRGVLGAPYSDLTLGKLAAAIVRIVTLDFSVREVRLQRREWDDFLYEPNELPRWDPLNAHIIPAGGTSIVISRHIAHAVGLIQQDYPSALQNQTQIALRSSSGQSRSYLILTVKDIALYQINGCSQGFIASDRLFNGYDLASERALTLLLEATQATIPEHRVNILPNELQDMILYWAAYGNPLVERAKKGCLMDCGTFFPWIDPSRPRTNLRIKRRTNPENETNQIIVVSHIWFHNHSSGVGYV
ncbi:hypothetical protein F5Y09DRAFT_356492 [Xylaria sp. FL1042]|nr:hypothetical protein F5Y09DRAFT_356492 [Xylaria sp. FL1042]